VLDAGDRGVVAVMNQRAVGSVSGAETEMRYGALFEFDGGRVARVRLYLDAADALAAGGLSEPA
jgi:ketosteroid isomerase-like protein